MSHMYEYHPFFNINRVHVLYFLKRHFGFIKLHFWRNKRYMYLFYLLKLAHNFRRPKIYDLLTNHRPAEDALRIIDTRAIVLELSYFNFRSNPIDNNHVHSWPRNESEKQQI